MLVPCSVTRTEIRPETADVLGAICSALSVTGWRQDRGEAGGAVLGDRDARQGPARPGLGARPSPTLAGGRQRADRVPGAVLSSFRVLGHTQVTPQFTRSFTDAEPGTGTGNLR